MSNIRFMVVDDEKYFLSAVEKIFAKRGHEIVTAGNGREALEKLTESEVDVIIMDVKMPVMDGITALVEIKKLYPLVEVILLTGHASVDSAIKGIDLGAFDYLMKPYDLDKLIEMAEEASSRKKLREQTSL